MNVLVPAISEDHFSTVSRLAWEILMPFYQPVIPVDHIEYFLERFLSVEALAQVTSKDFKYWCLQHNGVDAGFLGLQYAEDWLLLSKLYILEAYRGKGLGRMAIEQTVAEAHNHGYSEIRLTVNEHNDDGIAIYERLGYKRVELQTNSFPNGHSVRDWLMIKQL